MIKNQQQIESNQRQRFEIMAVRLANHLELSTATEFDELPAHIKTMLNSFKYIDLVVPLMRNDRDGVNQLSLRQLEIKYGVPKSTIRDYLTTRANK